MIDALRCELHILFQIDRNARVVGRRPVSNAGYARQFPGVRIGTLIAAYIVCVGCFVIVHVCLGFGLGAWFGRLGPGILSPLIFLSFTLRSFLLGIEGIFLQLGDRLPGVISEPAVRIAPQKFLE